MSYSPPLDPMFRDFWDALLELPPMAERTLEEIRAPLDRTAFGEPPPLHYIEDLTIAGAAHSIPVRLYRPSDEPEALIVYYHGGGWVFGGLDTHDIALRNFARLTGAAILSVEYRLAPEHPFPGPFDDCYAALQWADAHRGELGVGDVPLLVGGDSAGGNLAAAVAMATRDRGGPALAGQILLYPSLFGDAGKPSSTEHAQCGILLTDDMRWYWNCYAPTSAEQENPLAAPGLAESHADLPPAVIAAAEIDPLRDDALDYGKLMTAAGSSATVLRYPTMPHGFFSFASVVPAAMTAAEEIAVEVRKLVEQARNPAAT